MSTWSDLDLEHKVLEILRDVPLSPTQHHLGRPFLTAYQLAIEFARRYSEHARRIGLPIGGAEIGQRNSLAQYIAAQLSRCIKHGELPQIEGALLGNLHLLDISFRSTNESIHSSLTQTEYSLSMFRFQGDDLTREVE